MLTKSCFSFIVASATMSVMVGQAAGQTCFFSGDPEMAEIVYMDKDELIHYYCSAQKMKTIATEYGKIYDKMACDDVSRNIERVLKKDHDTEIVEVLCQDEDEQARP